jgi:hypothetical protein
MDRSEFEVTVLKVTTAYARMRLTRIAPPNPRYPLIDAFVGVPFEI